MKCFFCINNKCYAKFYFLGLIMNGKIKAIIFLCIIICTSLIKLPTVANSNEPKVSVIIPIYNTASYLRECLDSVTNQTLKDIEIICVNDGSTDDSLRIILEYAQKDARIKVLNTKNKGASAARNSGLKISSGEYIAFIDSDDWLDLNTYEVSYEKAKQKDADILIFGEDKFSVVDKSYKNPFYALESSGSMLIWNKLYKRSFLVRNNLFFYEKAKCYNDECFNSVVFPKAFNIESISNKFYHYRRGRKGSLQTLTSSKGKIENAIIYAEYVCNNWRENNYIDKYGVYLLKKVSFMINRSIKKLENYNEKVFYTTKLIKILGSDIYNQKNINKLDEFTQSLLENWIQYV
ncbi:MAG: Undecaprenyl-phosphate 4-deoxy-4-formamido-L-arabinose transferase [Eubacteriales bacterium SKADARSKE-1]|nr:Undecaprenyl-phosphate 4-deoxy-4-formamido-L-arabinose transferase [Eubacteriales bacterium SKADARSKE-1]